MALYQNNTTILKTLLKGLNEKDKKANALNDLVDYNGLNPLHLAIYNQNIESIDLLYEVGANINHKSTSINYPLIWAMDIFEISDQIIERLLELNADPNVVDQTQGVSHLIIAIMSDRINLVNLLIKYKADVNLTFDDPNINALKIAIDYYSENTNSEQIVKALLNAGAKINGELPEILSNTNNVPKDQTIALSEINQHNIELNQNNTLLNIESNRNFGRYPLIFSIYIGCKDLVKILLDYGAYPHTIHSDFYSPISSACYVNNNEIVNLLLDYGVNPTLSCYQSNTPLTISIARVKKLFINFFEKIIYFFILML